MNNLILIISLSIFILVFWLLYEIKQTAKFLINKNYNHERAEIIQLVILILLIILVVPFLFTLPVFKVYKSENGGTGEIGDTIGGLTAPFINGISAIMVYLAFKEQVKATHQTKNLELYKIINDRVNWLKSDPYDIVKIENCIKLKMASRIVPEHPYNKITYILLEFSELFKIANKSSDEKENLIRQIKYLYRILYRDRMITLKSISNVFVNAEINNKHPELIVVLDFLFAFEEIEKFNQNEKLH